MAEDSSVASLHHQQVALLATANGTHIAVQVGRSIGRHPTAREGKEREWGWNQMGKGMWLKKNRFRGQILFAYILTCVSFSWLRQTVSLLPALNAVHLWFRPQILRNTKAEVEDPAVLASQLLSCEQAVPGPYHDSLAMPNLRCFSVSFLFTGASCKCSGCDRSAWVDGRDSTKQTTYNLTLEPSSQGLIVLLLFLLLCSWKSSRP